MDRQTDRQTDSEKSFYSTLQKTRVQKIKFGTECNSHWGGKNNHKLSLFIKTIVERSNIHYSKINQKRSRKKYAQFSLELQKHETIAATNSAQHLEGGDRYFRHRYSIKIDVKSK